MPFIKLIPAEWKREDNGKQFLVPGSKTAFINAARIVEVVRTDQLNANRDLSYDKDYCIVTVDSSGYKIFSGAIYVKASPGDIVAAIATALRSAHHDGAVDCPMQKDPPEDPPAEKEPEAAPTD